MPVQESAILTHEIPTKSHLIIRIKGRLDANSVVSLWQKAQKLQKKYHPDKIVLNAKNISYCDSFGAALILQLQKNQLAAKKEFTLEEANSELEKILHFLTKNSSIHKDTKTHLDFVSRVGFSAFEFYQDFKENTAFLGVLAIHIGKSFFHPHKSIRFKDFWRAMDDVGPKALPIIVLIGFLIGLISTFQSILPLGRFGAQIYIIDLVGLGVVREVGPLLTSVLLAGRTASAFAAEIGSMKINEEIDALATLGLNPVIFLTYPRILAATIMTPLLSMFLMTTALIGSYIIMHTLGYNYQIFITEFLSAVTLDDFLSGLLKTFVFGAVIAGVGCLNGIKTKYGASAVGNSTTKAVVNSLIMLVFVDGIFALVYYVLKI